MENQQVRYKSIFSSAVALLIALPLTYVIYTYVTQSWEEILLGTSEGTLNLVKDSLTVLFAVIIFSILFLSYQVEALVQKKSGLIFFFTFLQWSLFFILSIFCLRRDLLHYEKINLALFLALTWSAIVGWRVINIALAVHQIRSTKAVQKGYFLFYLYFFLLFFIKLTFTFLP